MQLEGGPRDPDQALVLQLFDPNRVDIAPGSNVVREDNQVDGLVSHLDLCPWERPPGSYLKLPPIPHVLIKTCL
jgi:hypothetical protein